MGVVNRPRAWKPTLGMTHLLHILLRKKTRRKVLDRVRRFLCGPCGSALLNRDIALLEGERPERRAGGPRLLLTTPRRPTGAAVGRPLERLHLLLPGLPLRRILAAPGIE